MTFYLKPKKIIAQFEIGLFCASFSTTILFV